MGNKWLANMFDCNPTAKENRLRDAYIHTCMVKTEGSGQWLGFSYSLEAPSRVLAWRFGPSGRVEGSGRKCNGED